VTSPFAHSVRVRSAKLSNVPFEIASLMSCIRRWWYAMLIFRQQHRPKGGDEEIDRAKRGFDIHDVRQVFQEAVIIPAGSRPQRSGIQSPSPGAMVPSSTRSRVSHVVGTVDAKPRRR
jgi:hypothetical protein